MLGYPDTDPLGSKRIQTSAWKEASGDDACTDLVREAFSALEDTGCTRNLYRTLFYETTFLTYPPRGRIQGFCAAALQKRAEGGTPEEVAKVLIGQDYNGEDSCGEAIQVPGRRVQGWFTCTQIYHPIDANGVTDFFPPANISYDTLAQICSRDWLVETPLTPNYYADLFGWHRPLHLADSVSRILFAYGTNDAWAANAVSSADIADDLPVIWAHGGAHGSDLFGTVADDTDDMLAVRQKEFGHVARWVAAVQARQCVQR